MDDIVWAKNPANDMVSPMSARKFKIMERSGWTQTDEAPPAPEANPTPQTAPAQGDTVQTPRRRVQNEEAGA